MEREDIGPVLVLLVLCFSFPLMVFLDRAYPEVEATTVVYKDQSRLECDGRGE